MSFLSERIAVVTDSASYLPAHVRAAYGIAVAPMHIFLDGVDHREFVDLDGPAFYKRLAEGARVATSQPSPGEFLDLYTAAAEAGAEQVLSIHMGAAMSGTVQSATIASRMSPIPVTVVDTGQASFIEGLCVWAACEALASGGSIEDAKAAVAATAAWTGNVFIVKGFELMQKGGRLARDASLSPTKVPILALVDGTVRPIAEVDTREAALSAMVEFLVSTTAPGTSLRIGVGNGDADELATELEERVRSSAIASRIESLTPYEIGPAVGSHAGPGCTGIVFESLAGDR